MQANRLEAFSDGVIAIIITIMVLEIKVPHGEHLSDLLPLWPVFLSYVLSFLNVAVYWNNHHHLLHATRQVTGAVLWANANLLFWLSLMPWATGWMGENHFAAMPVAVYAGDLLLCSVSYILLQSRIIKAQGRASLVQAAVGNDLKGKVSMVGHLSAIPLALLGWPMLAGALLFAVTCIWLVPDRRIERQLADS